MTVYEQKRQWSPAIALCIAWVIALLAGAAALAARPAAPPPMFPGANTLFLVAFVLIGAFAVWVVSLMASNEWRSRRHVRESAVLDRRLQALRQEIESKTGAKPDDRLDELRGVLAQAQSERTRPAGPRPSPSERSPSRALPARDA